MSLSPAVLTGIVTLAISASAAPAASAAPPEVSLLGRKIAPFELQDFRGTARGLGDWADRKLLVVAFVGTECPLAKLYARRLAELAAEYGPRGVGVIAINSNQQDSLAELAHYARVHELEFPLLKDAGNAVADQFGAERTPEVFVLDAERVVRYRGRNRRPVWCRLQPSGSAPPGPGARARRAARRPCREHTRNRGGGVPHRPREQ